MNEPNASDRIVPLDNAAGACRRPPAVAAAMVEAMEKVAAAPGRSGHRLALAAERIVVNARGAIAKLLGVADPSRISFAANATEALNLALFGSLAQGDRALAGPLEHNSVTRPLHALEARRGVRIEILPFDEELGLRPEAVEAALVDGARLVAIAHGSNVSGHVLPLREIAAACRARGALLLVDAAQTAGAVPIDVERDGVDLLAFTGQKDLFGPPGIGGLYVRPGLLLEPLRYGGTGSNSERPEQPTSTPDRYESGTPNLPGIAGLAAGVRFVLETGVEAIEAKGARQRARMIEGLGRIAGVEVVGARAARGLPIVSFRVANVDPAEISAALDASFGVLTRPGLHCAPAAHRSLGTFPAGAVRLSANALTEDREIDEALAAVAEVVGALGA